ncbi:hypothetical protein LTR56_009720 [Elasticomyces elasticus]|nr:hypothetical protein LTR22_025078 [Elasticomyces elasticus]KAK3644183.1 hypothetical protein LTR56_009720 [Elasticomyces elasticus]KAK4919140.1 hypothetical protein LTR49_013144 [Elasticomyces elasticus]KAK5741803.1 hypothetical protein LTS12_024480 [Elasticomyces elasticus]
MGLPSIAVAALVAGALWTGLTIAVPAATIPQVDARAADDNVVVSTITVSPCTTSYASSATSTPTNGAPPTVLTPVPAPGVDGSDLNNLAPNSSAQLTYAQLEVDSAEGSTIATVSIDQMDHSAVHMLHTSFINNFTCTDSAAHVTFNSDEAYQFAVANWTSALPFVMITYHAECGDAQANGEHGFVIAENVTSTSPGSLTVTLSITHTDFGTAVGATTNVTVDLGTYSPSGNGSFSTNTTSTTGALSGLNSTFDDNLDDSLGPYISLQDNAKVDQILPNASTSSSPPSATSAADGSPTLGGRSSLARRGFWDVISSPFKAVGEVFEKAAVFVYEEALVPINEVVIQPAVGWVSNAVDTVEEEALKTLDIIDRFLSVDKSLSETLSVNEYPSSANSPRGKAYSIYSDDKVQAYCVGCGINGQITVTGRLTFSVAHGLQEGSIGADGNFHGVLQLGLVANVQYEKPFEEQTLASLSLSDLVLPGIIQIGPTVSLSAGGSITLGANGQLIAGAVLDWPAIHAKLDVASLGDAQASGWAPDIDPVFSVDGSVSATLDIHLRASLGFSIGLLNIAKFTTQVALIGQPGLKATAAYSNSATYGLDGCAGVYFSANVYNTVYADLLGSQKDIFDWTSPALSHCVKVGKRDINQGFAYTPAMLPRMSLPRIAAPVHKHKHRFGTKVARQEGSASTTTATNETGFDVASDNSTYSVVSSLDGLFEIHWSSNGNIYAVTSNDTTEPASDDMDGPAQDGVFDAEDVTTDFATYNETFLLGDANGRVLTGYHDEFDTHTVSRVRLHQEDSLPATSLVLSMRKVKDLNGGPDILGVQDTAGRLYAPIVCAYEKLFPKIFLAMDPAIRVDILNDLASITGPGLTSCGYVPLMLGSNQASTRRRK